MMFKTHLMFGFLVGLFAISFLRPANQLLFISIILLSAVFADIDHPDSKIGSKVKIIGFLFEHRGFFHSVFAVLLFGIAFFFLLHQKIYVYAALIGYASHLLADMINHMGIMPFHPFSRYRIKGFIKTNSMCEILIFVLLIILSGWKLVHL